MESKIKNIIEKVRKEGDSAVTYFTKKYDGISLAPKRFKVTEKQVSDALKSVDRSFISAVKQARKNIETFQKKIYPKPVSIRKNGIVLQYIFKPVKKAGVYVPGGRFPYPSTVLMTVIPAKVAGVEEVIMVSPLKNLTDEVLVTAKICGVNDIYGIGGAQAIAALTYGTRTIPKVDMIVGPGNAYVTEAKKQVFGKVGIEMLPGPSEVLIIADEIANPGFIVADLLAQCEHDKDARAFLISLSRKLSDTVNNKTKPVRKQIEIINVKNIAQAIKVADEIAPEHLEVIVKNPQKIIDKIRNAGAIFTGNYSPVAVGDYFAGPSHVLPTASTAKFSSGLSVYDFLKSVSVIQYSKSALLKSSKAVIKLAETEGMKKHADSIKTRIKELNK
ncbi:MAG: histidinol dehydrogenase [Elusimicrobia bacterium]|nr:histidinol dehydrogenase [Elusimicrobiota bacterium]